MTAINLRRRLKFPQLNSEELPINVVVRVESETISLLVDDVGDVLDVPDDCFETPPETLTGKVRDLIRGAYKLDDRLLLILDVEKVVNISSSVS